MSDQEQEVKSAGKQKSSVSLDELQSIINAAVTAALQTQAANTTQLAEAIRDSKTPYVDPKQKANNESMRRSMIEAKKQEKERTEFFQNKVCPHTMGSSPNSARSLPDSSFAVHTLDTGEIIGVCTNCQKVISSQVQDDIQWFAKKGGNIRSSAGQRTFMDPLRAQRARLGIGQEEIFVDEEAYEAAQ
jgi:hypothetical protein